ncbi:acyl-CoA reductase [Belliella kenyensis]|uniref:Acyl-CoA reductase n=1 Tax=Belliella kenyensis TaxID=1472724 RepID=A0ABV8ENU7_9BACT|nr:acyl-CoA reductase [Belliella kenyensis]MCH7402992.1 acyl-CoA reductase [Belliella kenyensis]MDN3605028.1 acyl-CoA reductase [Belliella kenyensis]
MTLEERIFAFDHLGKRLSNLSDGEFDDLAWRVENNNSWFTKDHTKSAIEALCSFLELESLKNWVAKYTWIHEGAPKNIGILMAGNVPGVGFHDLLSVLITGHQAAVKLSSSDSVLIKWLTSELIEIEPRFEKLVRFEEMLKGKDAYIATGSDNSARYFEYYFGKYPSIIRKNRTSIAILNGNEKEEDFLDLGKDVFQYFGLGCRNVSKLYVPNRSILTRFLDNMNGFQLISSHHKYINNYDYNKSIYLINGEDHLDNGFLLLKESQDLVSPIAVLYYEIYDDLEILKTKISDQKDKIQCIVSQSGWYENSETFGQAQCPKLDDYADNVDTLEFLLGLYK